MEEIKFLIEIIQLYLALGVAVSALCGWVAVVLKMMGYADDD